MLNIKTLKDQQITAIVGYYLTEHMVHQVLAFMKRLEDAEREMPFTASVAIAREFMSWARYRDHAAIIIQTGLFKLRDRLVEAIERTISLSDQNLQDICVTVASASPQTRKDLATNTITAKFLELEHLNTLLTNDTSSPDSSASFDVPGTNEIDDLIYSRYLTWLDVLNAIPPAPPEHWKKSHYIPSWSAEHITEQVFAFTALDGPMKWLTMEGGKDLAAALADGFMRRAHLRVLGLLVREMAGVFAFFLQPVWVEGSGSSGSSVEGVGGDPGNGENHSGMENGNGTWSSYGQSIDSSVGRPRCPIG
jgi:hypothetical protein